MKTFGEVIAELRRGRGFTQKVLAAQVKKKDGTAIGLAYMNDIEHDRRGPPAADFVVQLAKVLGVPLEVLQFYAGRLLAEAEKERPDPSHNGLWQPIGRSFANWTRGAEINRAGSKRS